MKAPTSHRYMYYDEDKYIYKQSIANSVCMENKLTIKTVEGSQ